MDNKLDALIDKLQPLKTFNWQNIVFILGICLNFCLIYYSANLLQDFSSDNDQMRNSDILARTKSYIEEHQITNIDSEFLTALESDIKEHSDLSHSYTQLHTQINILSIGMHLFAYISLLAIPFFIVMRSNAHQKHKMLCILRDEIRAMQ